MLGNSRLLAFRSSLRRSTPCRLLGTAAMNDLNAVRAKFCMEEVRLIDFFQQTSVVPRMCDMFRFCGRTSDHTNFLCGTLLPPKARDSYFAFRAFNSQAASIADQVVSMLPLGVDCESLSR